MFFDWVYDGRTWVAYLPVKIGRSATKELQKELFRIARVSYDPLSLTAVRPDKGVGVAVVDEATHAWLLDHPSMWFPLK